MFFTKKKVEKFYSLLANVAGNASHAQSQAQIALNQAEKANRRLDEISQNGMATHVNRLNKEVFGKRKKAHNGDYVGGIFARLSQHFGESELQPVEEATLAGKVDAIIEHLGLDVTVKPEEVSPAKPVAKKKATPKKKGRR